QNQELAQKVAQTSQELSFKQKRYADMFDAAANIIILIGKTKKIEEWNKAAENFFEINKKEALGANFEDVIRNKVMRADILDKIAQRQQISDKNEYQINIKTKSGKKYQILWTTSPLFDSSNQLSSILVIGQDVSFRVVEEQERKRSEAKLRNNYLFLNSLLNSMPSPVYYKNTEGQYMGCNAEFANFFGLKTEQIIGKYTRDINAPDASETIIKEDEQLFKTGKKQIKEVLSTYKDGKTHHFILSKTAFYNPDKSLGGLVGVMVEITRQKQMEEELRESEMFFKGITDSANDAIILTDEKFKIHFWNKAAELLFGYSKEEILNEQLYTNILDIKNKKTFVDSVSEISLGDKKTTLANIIELEAFHKNRKKFPVEFSISDIKIRKKKYIIIIAKDNTQRKKTEHSLLEAKEKAEEADRLKSSFLSNMSHEIRTPMNAIVGFSQLLANAGFDETKKQVFIEQINLNSDSLLQLIEDIIYVSKIEAGKIEIKMNMCLINSLLNELEISFIEHKRRLGKEHLPLEVIKSIKNPNFSILTDSQRFKQIMTNLIGNALKFTEEGSISFGYEVKDENELLFFVKDTGLGINKEKLRYVFDRFTKVSASKTKLYGGTGLGLSITKHLVERLGGKIWVESKEDVGSTFYFTLPYKVSSTEPKKESISKSKIEKMSLENTHILIAEDEQMNYFFLQEALSNTGASLEWAKNGLEAVKFIESERTFDLVLMDMKMPIMDGYEATEKIKKIKPEIPVIAQTAYAMPEEQKKGYQAGCDFYLSKPIDPDLLIDTIHKYLQKKKNN
ncbi:MAG: PAS domain S-box protein, partial [Bacteroidales bacterium]|nr:PAS domain S-box protein [Bacteroidales bacterium]